MKKILFSLILAFSLIFTTSSMKANNKNIDAILIGSPFYIASIYCFYKIATFNKFKGDYAEIFNALIQMPLIVGGTTTCLLGTLISAYHLEIRKC